MNTTAANQPLPENRAPAAHPPITAPTLRDVLQGRGQGVQRHPGNVKYRTLVFVNKGLYAKCPRSDKMKISKGIVAAVRELGGRFLQLDERTGIYKDIGDKKAVEKTSQALREGQTQIRKQMYKDEEMAGNTPTHDTSLLGSGPQREISAEGYFGYSAQVLESLYNADESALTDVPSAAAAAAGVQPPNAAAPAMPPLQPPQGVPSASSNAMAMAMDQFPGAVQPMDTQPTASIGRFTNELGRPSLRLTNMSNFSLFSIRQLLDDANKTDRNTIESNLAAEIHDLIRLSSAQLMQVDRMTVDDKTNGNIPASFDTQDMMQEDRVSDLRFTDLSRDLSKDSAVAKVGGGEPRLTRSSQSSDASLMDASMMTIPAEDMSVRETAARESGMKSSGGTSNAAEALLRLSTPKK